MYYAIGFVPMISMITIVMNFRPVLAVGLVQEFFAIYAKIKVSAKLLKLMQTSFKCYFCFILEDSKPAEPPTSTVKTDLSSGSTTNITISVTSDSTTTEKSADPVVSESAATESTTSSATTTTLAPGSASTTTLAPGSSSASTTTLTPSPASSPTP